MMLRKGKHTNALEIPRLVDMPNPDDYQMPNALLDPLGSWTGVPANPWEKPVQDADDL